MHHSRLLIPVLLATTWACDRGTRERDVAVADTTGVTEDAAAVLALLSPVRAMSIAEVESGQFAAQRAAAPTIREYAATIAADHRALVGVLDSVARLRQTALTITQDAQELESMVRMAHAGQDQLTAPDFDVPFMRAEIESHRQMLERLDQRLIPAATSTDMKTLLIDVRAMTDAHLARARQLLAQALGEVAAPDTRPGVRPGQPGERTGPPVQPSVDAPARTRPRREPLGTPVSG